MVALKVVCYGVSVLMLCGGGEVHSSGEYSETKDRAAGGLRPD